MILELGGNDGLRGIPMESMQSNLEELIVAFQKGGARVILAGMTLPRNLWPGVHRRFREGVFRARVEAQSYA